MSSKVGAQYTLEFKLEAVRLVEGTLPRRVTTDRLASYGVTMKS